MNGLRITFSPHTADPRFLSEVAMAAAAAQLAVAAALWGAQAQLLQAMMAAHVTFIDQVRQAASRPG